MSNIDMNKEMNEVIHNFKEMGKDLSNAISDINSWCGSKLSYFAEDAKRAFSGKLKPNNSYKMDIADYVVLRKAMAAAGKEPISYEEANKYYPATYDGKMVWVERDHSKWYSPAELGYV